MCGKLLRGAYDRQLRSLIERDLGSHRNFSEHEGKQSSKKPSRFPMKAVILDVQILASGYTLPFRLDLCCKASDPYVTAYRMRGATKTLWEGLIELAARVSVRIACGLVSNSYPTRRGQAMHRIRPIFTEAPTSLEQDCAILTEMLGRRMREDPEMSAEAAFMDVRRTVDEVSLFDSRSVTLVHEAAQRDQSPSG